VNASASSLDREVEVQSEIQKVRRFSHCARVVCSAIFGFGLVGVTFMLLVAAFGLFFPKVHSATTALATTPQLKMWMTLLTVVMAGVMLAGVHQLYRLFGNLAAGAIYTPENVRRVRHLGLLSLLWAVLAIAVPSASTALLALGFLDASIPKSLLVLPWSESLSSAVSAGLLVLVSWIMDVGLHAKDHADALQRDADLVI
jgi:hypothetical protein